MADRRLKTLLQKKPIGKKISGTKKRTRSTKTKKAVTGLLDELGIKSGILGAKKLAQRSSGVDRRPKPGLLVEGRDIFVITHIPYG